MEYWGWGLFEWQLGERICYKPAWTELSAPPLSPYFYWQLGSESDTNTRQWCSAANLRRFHHLNTPSFMSRKMRNGPLCTDGALTANQTLAMKPSRKQPENNNKRSHSHITPHILLPYITSQSGGWCGGVAPQTSDSANTALCEQYYCLTRLDGVRTDLNLLNMGTRCWWGQNIKSPQEEGEGRGWGG